MEETSIEKGESETDQTPTQFDEKNDDLYRITRDVEQFIHELSDKASGACAGAGAVPDCVQDFTEKLETRIHSYNSGESGRIFGRNLDEDAVFMEAVKRMGKLMKAVGEFGNLAMDNDSLMHQMNAVLQGALVFLGEEFRTLLEDSSCEICVVAVDNQKSSNFFKHSSFDSKHHHSRSNSGKCADDYRAYPPEVAAKLAGIASTMISAERETDCSQVYTFARRNAIRNYMAKQGFELEVNSDDVVKLPWESLEKLISRWITVVKACSEVIFPEERKLVDSIFSDSPKIRRSLLGNIVSIVVVQLLDFAYASSKTKRAAEKLFRFLDMYESLRNLVKSIGSGQSPPPESSNVDEDTDADNNEVISEVVSATDRIAEAAASIFCDLENSIKSDATRTPVPGGAVHPLTRYVMNYLQYACEYRESLETIFQKHSQLIKSPNISDTATGEKESESPHGTTPFAAQVIVALDLLDANLNDKSKLYKDASLHNIFLMNNGRYILQKIRNSNEIRRVVSDTWCRKRSSVVRQYHKNYQRETCNRVLQCLSPDGVVGANGKASKTVLKERLKTFTTVLDEIHKTQSTWVVNDEQLQSELRISISAVVIPAYRSFIGRFRHFLSEKQVNKYIKYQPEDVEAVVEGLFEGHAASTPKKKP
ncbi:exocyst complex component EXO70B1 [Andrographis paniculata]|uniref:exocyst complex component EXO70B1 n=1 Tax=Andrographis paniculata TaxID=175694 RepID=UPI0021E7404C|nr:exocyst complex component EXO70B1 [Andrographis paniculata]